MKYLKLFDEHTDYMSYKNNPAQFVTPNVSYCILEDEMHYNKYSEQRVVATINVTTTSSPTQIVGYDDGWGYLTDGWSKIEIDGVELDTVPGEYQFTTTGEHIIKYTKYDDSTDYIEFINFENLVSVKCPGWCTSGVWCTNSTSLVSIEMSDGPTVIPDSAFEGCTSLTSVVIPNSVTRIRGNGFKGCSSLQSITLPNGITTIDENAFLNCSGLTEIAIPSSVVTIGRAAFMGCTSLSGTVELPSTLTSIGDYAFQNAPLTSVICYAMTPPTIVIEGQETPQTIIYVFGRSERSTPVDILPLYSILVPSSVIGTYKSASLWEKYQSRIAAITE